ncbi:MAG TPA: immunoglobulin domain-containing protein, partial [Candidatus Acidoferrum sp.]|nr:immunoglobulin domain-containing protein [Candidatus Acidoferrum sp.]
VIGFCSLAESLDAPQFSWTNSAIAWSCQTNITHDTEDAAVSGAITHDGQTYFETTIVGPGTLTFWWKVSSEPTRDLLRLYRNGSEQLRISGNIDWEGRTFSVPPGTNIMRWIYSKNGSDSGDIGADRGWVDEINYQPSAPVITTHPAGRSVDSGSNATFTVAASGQPPLSYQWLSNGVAMVEDIYIRGTTNAALTLFNVQASQAGGYSVIVSSAQGNTISSNALLSVTQLGPLAEGLDVDYALVNGGTVPWVGQSVVSHDGVDAGRSGKITHNQSSSFSRQFVGPGTVTFWWKVSSEPNDRFVFSTNGNTHSTIFGDPVVWQLKTVTLSSGTHTLLWNYSKGSGTTLGEDHAWVDELRFIPTSVAITASPTNQIVDQGANATFTVGVSGTPPIKYQWRWNGTNILDATNAALVVPNVQPSSEGGYSVLASNAAGSATSGSGSLLVNRLVPIAEAVDVTNLTFTTSGSNPSWVGQTLISRDGTDAARSGKITHGQTNSILATVTGPGSVSFWWKVSSEPSNDRLGFYENNSSRATTSGESNWTWRTFTVSSGSRILEWRYTKNTGSTSVGQDAGWVDQIVYVPSNTPTPPVIVMQPTNRIVVPPTNVTFSTIAVGSAPLGYQWHFNGSPLTNGAGITGVTSTNLSITGVTVAHAGDYSVVVTNLAGSIASTQASLTVVTAPVITNAPISRNVIAGSTVTFTVGAIGQAPLSYRWMFNGTNLTNGGKINGATTTTLTVTNVQTAQEGAYSVIVSNAAGIAISSQSGGALTTWEAARITATNSESTVIEASVTGPGTIRFTWKVSSETNSDYFRFLIGGLEQTNITGEVDWRDEVLPVGDGLQSLQWSYSKDASGSAGEDAAWLDSVEFIPSGGSAAPSIASDPISRTVDAGATFSFDATATGALPLSYEWRFNGAPLHNNLSVSGAKTSRLTLANVQPSQAGGYSLYASNSFGSVTSSVAALAITSPPPSALPVIVLAPTSQTASENSNVTLNVVATGLGPLSYQWQCYGTNLTDTTNVAGTATPTLVLSSILPAQSGDYSVIVSNASGTAMSANASVMVLSLADAAGAPYLLFEMAGYNSWIAQTNVTHDGTNALRSGIIPDGQNTRLETYVDGPGTVTFWWKVSCESADNLRFTIGANEMSRISGEVNWQQQTFTVPPGTNILMKWRYGKDAEVGSVAGQDAGWVDDIRYVYTGPQSAVPVITNQPANASVLAGATVSFEGGVTGLLAMAYQWSSNGVPIGNGPNVMGARTPRLTLKNVQPGHAGSYSLFVSNTAGNVTSIPVSLNVTPAIAAPIISGQPIGQRVREGAAASFSVVANGVEPLAYQWQFNGSDILDATAPTLALSDVGAEDLGNYSVVVTNAAGVATSARASLTVVALNDVIGAPYLNFSVTGSSPWLMDDGQSSGPQTTNAGAILTVSTPPSITGQPASQSIVAGNPVTFSVNTAGSAPLAFQWRLGGVPISDGNGIDGATTSALTINNVDSVDAGNYSVVVSNMVGGTTSANAALTIIMPPMITSQPQDQTSVEGSTVSIAVGATGTGITYQWRRNGTNLVDGGTVSGTRSATLVMTDVQAFQSGEYSVEVSNVVAKVVSAGAQIFIAAAMTLGESINAPYLGWDTALTTPWTVQTNVTHDGEAAARSGAITNNGTTWFETTVTGPGAIHFWWKVSSQTNSDFLNFYVAGALWASISGEVDWTSMSTNLPAGTMVLRWAYAKNASGTNGLDRGWLDEVDFLPVTGPSVPVIVAEPVGKDVNPGSNVTFSVEALGTAPLSYQWRFEGQNLSDGPTILGSKSPTLTLLDAQTYQSGLYDVVVKNPYSIAISRQAFLNVIRPISLREALDTDNTNHVWIAGGFSEWFGQTDVNADRIDAAQSAPLPNGQSNFISTIVSGPGAISFLWKVSSETNRDRLRFSINGVEQTNISGQVDWRSRTFYVPLANSLLQWTYTKDASNSAGLDRAWVDMVTFGPSAPVITNSGPDVTYVDQGTTVRLSVDASGTPKFSYQWVFNGTNLVNSDTNFPVPGMIIG